MSETKEENNKGPKGKSAGTTRSFDSSALGLGKQIGPYKLLSILGEGGYGIVYLAEQLKPVKRRVALKVIKPGMDTKEVIARFEAERQALALLEHPNIAHVFNAGTTEIGRPYFVMEYVKGVPITEHCDRQKLTIEERLNLFLRVCEAVQYAHQKGIIHRDIKPSNIQVSIQGEQVVPKVIDFGVAKAISQPLTERTLVTEQGQFVGTPEYMSPEQAEMTGQDIDTRSDIYSLGAVFYELLTGVLPFDAKTLREGGLEHIRYTIREEEPKTPSTRLSTISGEESMEVARLRRTDIRTLGRKLHGDLDWITIKAMEKDRTRRYQTAHALAEDIQRHLNHEPVLAGPPSKIYRIKKFLRKHRTQAVAAAITAFLLACIAVVSVMYLRAIKRGKEAEFLEHKEVLSKAMELRSNGQFQEALTKVKAILNSEHVGPKARLLRARLVLELQSPAEAIKELEELLNERDEIACQAHFLLARIYLETDPGDPETAQEYQQKAKEHQQKGEKLFSQSAEAYFNRSMMAGTVIKTLEWLNKAVDFDPGHYDSREARALAYYALRKYNEMEIDASVMIGLESNNSQGYALRAIARREKAVGHGEKELLSEAIRDHNKAIKLSPDGPELYDQRHRTHMAMGNYEKVLSDAQQCARLAPNEGIYHFRVFCALVVLGRYEQAKLEYSTIIKSGLMEKGVLDSWAAKYVSDTLDAGLSWHPSERRPEGAAFLAMHESAEVYEQLAKKAKRVVPEGFHSTWSPDGTELAYSCGILGFAGIEILNLQSGKTQLLTVPGFDPAWSPDGRHIAFTRHQQALLLTDITAERAAKNPSLGEREIWIIKADGTEEPRFLARGYWPCWSRDSKRVFYHLRLDNKLYSISIEDGAKPTPIVRCPSSFPAVSPDEKYIAFRGRERQIVELSTSSVVASWTVPLAVQSSFTSWSPDGQELSVGDYGNSGLWIYDVKTKKASKVLSGSFGWCSWSRPDISQMAIDRVYGLHHEIWVAEVAALRPTRTIQEHCQEMVDFYTRRIETDPGDADNYPSRAECYVYLQDNKKAFADLEKYADIVKDPSVVAQTYDTLAWPLVSRVQEMVNPEIAVELYCKAHEMNKENWLYLNGLGIAHYRAGQWEEAINALTKSTELPGGQNTWNFLFLSMAHWQSGNKETTVKWYNKTVQAGKGNFDTLMRLNPNLYNLYSEALELMGIKAKDFDREAFLTGKQILSVTAQADSSHPDMAVAHVIDGTGLTDGDADGLLEHDGNPENMWLSEQGQTKCWVEFDLGDVYGLGSVLVWNYNERSQTKRGVKTADISTWTQEAGWQKIFDDFEFVEAEGSFDYDEPALVRFDEVKAQKVRFDDVSNLGDQEYVGLSEVRFFQRRGPEAIRPYPADGANIGSPRLSWTPGVGVKAHKLYLGTSPDSLKYIGSFGAADTSEVKLPRLEMHQKYLWRVDAQNLDGTIIKGKLWSFLTGGMVAWWKFDEGSGSTVADSSGNNYAATLVGGPQWVAGYDGGALQFDGTDDYVELPIGSLISSLTNSTFATRVNFSNAGGAWQRIFDFGSGTTVYMFLTPNNEYTDTMRFAITVAGNTAEDQATAPTTLASGWHHVAVTIDTDNGIITLYLDGSVVAQNTQATLSPNALGNTTNNWLGRSQYADDAYYKGLLDDFRIYNYALSEDEVKALYAGSGAGQTEH
jgi:serine/threonine protein kinase